MRALSASELISLWERGPTQTPVQRALALLSAAHPDTSIQELAHLRIGLRDALLLTLREWTFGPRLVSVTACPNCRRRLELDFAASDVRVTPEVEPAEALSLTAEGYEVQFRLPTSLDLGAIVDHTDVTAAQNTLLKRCALSVRYDGEETDVEHLPKHIVEMIAERMEKADPQADIRLSTSCPDCGHEWQAAFDIVIYFWNEIDAWAQRTLRDIHTLASAYGWRETDILAMSPWRRQFYLEMISG